MLTSAVSSIGVIALDRLCIVPATFFRHRNENVWSAATSGAVILLHAGARGHI
jgi:hypothetical protein